MILPDSNVLIDILERDAVWFDWSVAQLTEAARADRVAINHVIVAEVAPFSGDLAIFLAGLAAMQVEVEPFCNESAYSAGMAFREYLRRRDRAAVKSILPDFLIGGHAEVLGATILTRDPRFYRTYFPSVRLIAPSKDEND